MNGPGKLTVVSAPKLSARFQNPAERGTRGVNDPVGGPQTRDVRAADGAPRTFEQGNPAKCAAKSL